MAKRSKRLSWLRLPRWLARRTEAAPKLTDRELAKAFRAALSAVLEGDYTAAEREIETAVLADSDDIEPYRALARLYRRRGEIGRAIKLHQNLLLRRGLDDRTRNAVLVDLAMDFRQGGFMDRAQASYQEVLAHDPKDPEALRAARELAADAGDHDEALALHKRLVRAEKRADPAAEARLLSRLAAAEYGAGKHDTARKALKKALRRDPALAEARVLLGRLEAERGKNKAAMAAWRTVAEAGGLDAATVHPLVEASYAALDKPREYEAFVRELLVTRPDDTTARIALAETLAARGESNEAILELRRVLDADPDNVGAHIALGRQLLARNLEAEAVKAFADLLGWLDERRDRLARIGELEGLSEPVQPLSQPHSQPHSQPQAEPQAQAQAAASGASSAEAGPDEGNAADGERKEGGA